MVIYEVNLLIDRDIYPKFQSWLKKHVEEMLQFTGFIQASILKPEEKVATQEKLTIHYQLENRAILETYFRDFAPKMREEGLSLFKDKFSAERRVLEVQGTIFK